MVTDPSAEGIQDRIRILETAIANLEARVISLENEIVPGRPSRAPDEPPATTLTDAEAARTPDPLDERTDFNHLLALVGRSIMVLALAFLVRFLTDSGTLAPVPGATLGVTLGLVLILLVPRAMRKRDVAGALAHAMTAAVIVFPLVFETVVTLDIIPVELGAGLLALVSGTGLLIAWRARLRPMAWVFTLAAISLCFALVNRTGEEVLIAGIMLVLGAATCLLAYSRHWHLLRWVAASALGMVLLRMILVATGAAPGIGPAHSPQTVQYLCLVTMFTYLAIFGWRALVQGRGVKTFDIVQSAVSVLLGFGGAARIALVQGTGTGLVITIAIAGAVAGYAISFTVVTSRHGRGRAFFYFATLALVFLFLGSLLVAHGPWLTWLWLVLGLTAGILGSRFHRVTLRYHASFYLVMATIKSGLFLAAWKAFFLPPASSWPTLSSPGVLTFLTSLVTYLILVQTQRGRHVSLGRLLPRFILASILLLGCGYFSVTALVSLLSSLPPSADPAILALCRTLVIAITSTLLALVAKRFTLDELGWLVYPLLLTGCGKLLLEDLKAGSAITLAVSFAALGAALILGPRILHADRAAFRISPRRPSP